MSTVVQELALPTPEQLASFSGAYRLEVELRGPFASTLPIRILAFDVEMKINKVDLPAGKFREQPGGLFENLDDAGFVEVQPEGLGIDFCGAWIVGTPYTVVSSWVVVRQGHFQIVDGRGTFSSGHVDLPNLSIVRPSPPSDVSESGLWSCGAFGHAVSLVPR